MAIGSLDPIAVQQWFDNNGNPLAGGKLYFYLAGTETPSPVYADQFLLTALPNPLVLDAAGRAPQHYLDALSYKEVLKNANDVTIWTADNVTSPAALRNTTAVISVTGPQHDVAVPSGIVTFIEFRNSSLVTIDGFSGGSPGQLLILRALGTGQVDLLPAGGGSQPANQLINFVTSGPTSLAGIGPSGAGTAVYLKVGYSYWILITHEQGASIRMPFNAANFVGTPGSWVVEAADVSACDYKLTGASVMYNISLQDTTITGAPSTLRIQNLPYIHRTATGYLPMGYRDAAEFKTGLVTVAPDFRNLDLAKSAFDAWTAGTTQYVAFQISADVK